MSDPERPRLVPEPLDGYAPTVADALWLLEDARDRTSRLIDRIADEAVDWVPPWGGNTIGSILYHLAAIELDWLYSEILEAEPPPEFLEFFPHEVREVDGKLTRVTGETIDAHLARLFAVRARFLHLLRDMDEVEFGRVRALEPYDVAPMWVIQHLCQHEAEHRGQIGEIAAAGGFLAAG